MSEIHNYLTRFLERLDHKKFAKVSHLVMNILGILVLVEVWLLCYLLIAQIHSNAPNPTFVSKKLEFFVKNSAFSSINPLAALRILETFSNFPEKWLEYQRIVAGSADQNYFWSVTIFGLCELIRGGVSDSSKAGMLVKLPFLCCVSFGSCLCPIRDF